jgi:glutathionyl-hydroquinone reductase
MAYNNDLIITDDIQKTAEVSFQDIASHYADSHLKCNSFC